MRKSTVLVDMDGVLVDLLSTWLKSYNTEYEDALTIDEFGSDFENIHKIVKSECGEKIYDYFGLPGFSKNLQPLPGAVEGFKELVANPKFDTFICSSFGGYAYCAQGKIQWLEQHCPFFDTEKAYLCHDKFRVFGDILLDDSVDNLTKWQDFQEILGEDSSLRVTPVLMTAPHNFKNETLPHRVNNMQEFNELLKVLV